MNKLIQSINVNQNITGDDFAKALENISNHPFAIKFNKEVKESLKNIITIFNEMCTNVGVESNINIHSLFNFINCDNDYDCSKYSQCVTSEHFRNNLSSLIDYFNIVIDNATNIEQNKIEPSIMSSYCYDDDVLHLATSIHDIANSALAIEFCEGSRKYIKILNFLLKGIIRELNIKGLDTSCFNIIYNDNNIKDEYALYNFINCKNNISLQQCLDLVLLCKQSSKQFKTNQKFMTIEYYSLIGYSTNQ